MDRERRATHLNLIVQQDADLKRETVRSANTRNQRKCRERQRAEKLALQEQVSALQKQLLELQARQPQPLPNPPHPCSSQPSVSPQQTGRSPRQVAPSGSDPQLDGVDGPDSSRPSASLSNCATSSLDTAPITGSVEGVGPAGSGVRNVSSGASRGPPSLNGEDQLAAELQVLLASRPPGAPHPEALQELAPAGLVGLLQQCTQAIGRTVQSLGAAAMHGNTSSSSNVQSPTEPLPLELLSAAAHHLAATATTAASGSSGSSKAGQQPAAAAAAALSARQLEVLLQQQLRVWCWLSSYCHLKAPQEVHAALPQAVHGTTMQMDDVFWGIQLGQLVLSPSQANALTSAAHAYLSTLQQLSAGRRAACAALLAINPDTLCSVKDAIRQQQEGMELVFVLQQNILRQRVALVQLQHVLYQQVLTSRDLATLVLRCHPHPPDAISISLTLMRLLQQQLTHQRLPTLAPELPCGPAAAAWSGGDGARLTMGDLDIQV